MLTAGTPEGSAALREQYPILGPDVDLVTDYDEIKEVLASPAFRQAAHSGESAPLMRGVLNVLDGEPHRTRRRTMAPLLSRSAIEQHQGETLLAVISLALDEAARGRSPDGLVRADLVALVWRMLHRFGARVAGIDGLDDPQAADRFVSLVQAFARAITVEWSREQDRGRLLAEGRAALTALEHEFYAPSLAARRPLVEAVHTGRLPAADLPLDLVTVLELHRESAWEDDLPLREVCVFLMAASATTSHAFPRLVVELENWLAGQPGNREELLRDDRLLRGAVFESLRLFVASPARLRRATQDVVLSSGRRVGAGQVLALFFRPASERHTPFGAAADRFDPLRSTQGMAAWGLAFGAGAHACPGRPLVVGSKQNGYLDGTLMTLARSLYQAGMVLDPAHPLQPDASTYYDSLAELPIVLRRL